MLLKLMEKYYLTSKNIFWLILVTVSFVILYPKFPLLNIQGTYVAIRVEDIFVALSIFVWFLKNLKNLKEILSSTIVLAILLFWLTGALSLFSGIFITHSVTPHIGFLHLLRRIEMMSLFIVLATSISDLNQVKIFLKVMFVVLMLVLIYGFGQIYLSFPVVSTTNSEFSKGFLLKLTPEARVNSTFAGHYDLAVYLSLSLVFLSGVFLYLKGKTSKVIIVTTSLLSFILLGFTAARVSFVATLLALAANFWILGKKRLVLALVLLTLATIALVPELRHRMVATITVNLLGGGGPKYQPPPNSVNIFTPDTKVSPSSKAAIIKEATQGSAEAKKQSSLSADIAPGEPTNVTELGVYRSFNIRTDVEWPRAQRAFLKNPILGTGYSSINLATDNDILRSLGETGILGTLSLMLVFFIIIKKLFIFLKTNTDAFKKQIIISTLLASMIVFMTGLVIDVLEASKIAVIIWTMLGLAWAVTKKEGDIV